MKKLFSVCMTVLFLLSFAGCSGQTAAPASQPDVQNDQVEPLPSAEDAQPQISEPEVIAVTPNQAQKTEATAPTWIDEPQSFQFDLEETVSCTYTLPCLTLETSEASAAANAVFDSITQTITSYAQETVYPTAQEKQATGFLNGGYSITEEDGTLLVCYAISVSYSTETTDNRFEHTYTLSLSTGELLKEE